MISKSNYVYDKTPIATMIRILTSQVFIIKCGSLSEPTTIAMVEFNHTYTLTHTHINSHTRTHWLWGDDNIQVWAGSES